MNGYRINLSSSIFERFIKDRLLYIDKSLFIEHFFQELSDVILITRPRRMGKSLNMNMLDAYLDVKRDSAGLFAGLKIEGRPCFREHLNRYPVIYLDFRFLRAENYRKTMRDMVMDHVRKYLSEEKWTDKLRAFAEDRGNTDSGALKLLTENLHEAYGERAVILIDEYDHMLMDNIGKKEYEDIRDYISAVFETALKGNAHLYKALLTGVLRVSQESMFSKLNNIKVYDVFKTGPFDEDFGLTEAEVRAVAPPEKFAQAKDWYNNVHIGNSWMFYVYSLMSYLDSGTIADYWGQSGTMDLLGDLITSGRALKIGEAVKELGACFEAAVDPRVSLRLFFQNEMDEYYYAVALQAGYLTFEREAGDGEDWPKRYLLRVPNRELMHVWRAYILSRIVRDPQNRLGKIFAGIADLERFSRDLEEFVSFKLSCFDFDAKALEKIYHVFIFGMLLTAGFECRSNREAGYGRYDILVEAPDWTAAIEFKAAKRERDLRKAAREGLSQIYDHKYLSGARSDRGAYAIGVGCYKAGCVVLAEKAW